MDETNVEWNELHYSAALNLKDIRGPALFGLYKFDKFSHRWMQTFRGEKVCNVEEANLVGRFYSKCINQANVWIM